MPCVNIRLTPGITDDECRKIVEGVTDLLVKVLDKEPEQTHIVIDEVDESRWGFSGRLTSDFRKPG